jgi:molybdenum cofactor cytidylyltransferase
MGRLKQLLPYRGEPLLAHAINQARKAGLAPIVVVVGAQADAVRSAIASMEVEIAQNDQWKAGMGTSIAAGVKLTPPVDAIMLLAGDQPLVTAQHLAAIRNLFETTGADAVAAEYCGTIGVPALFHGTLMERLAELPPSGGAKILLQSPDVRVARYPLPEAAADVDTPEDWQRLLSSGRMAGS